MSKILAVDAGNTRVKCAVIEDGAVLEQWSFLTKHAKSKTRGALARVDLPVVLASVVPSATEAVRKWCEANGRELHVIANANQSTIKSREELGADLLAASVCALKLYGKGRPVAVIGMGTAVTLTAIAGDGVFQGAWFTLGMKTTRETLMKRAALLRDASTSSPSNIAFGTDTASCVDNGVLLGLVGTVRAYADQARHLLGKNVLVVATGGDSSLVVPLANKGRRKKAIDIVDADLTLKGIYLLFQERTS